MWKKLGIKGQVKNYSSKPLWVIETDSGRAVAHLLQPMSKSPPDVDADGIRRVDGKAIDGHRSWWKFYDFSIMEVFDDGDGLKTSVIRKMKVDDSEFAPADTKVIYDRSSSWGVQVNLITDVQRRKVGKRRRITKYHVSNVGWLKPDAALEMTCRGEIDNARPVFPSGGRPYIRTRRDKQIFNNLEVMG